MEGAATKANPAAHWAEGEAWAYRRDAYAAMAALLGSRPNPNPNPNPNPSPNPNSTLTLTLTLALTLTQP